MQLAMRTAPTGTRAAVRAALLTEHEGRVARADWSQLILSGETDSPRIDLRDPFGEVAT